MNPEDIESYVFRKKMDTMGNNNKTVYRVPLTAVLAPLVFVASVISVPVPAA